MASIEPEKLVIVHYPHPALRTKGKPVGQVNDLVKRVAARMCQLMHEAPGVGLAAPQVGLPWRMFVANNTGQPENDTVFINPKLLNPSSDVSEYDEGCLSLPDITAMVTRPNAIEIEATNLEGETFRLASDQLPARIWQHEYDHLDAVLILDRMTPADKRANKKKIKLLEEAKV
jgi:peptide deformylase